MIIEIHDTDIEARLAKQINATGASTAVRALERRLETQEERNSSAPYLKGSGTSRMATRRNL